METFEPSPQPLGNPNIDIPLPEEPDEEWCAMFNEAYGGRGKRVIVPTLYYLREIVSSAQCRPKDALKSMRKIKPQIASEDGICLDGEVVGMRMVGLEDESFGGLYYLPHLILRDAIDVEEKFDVARSDQEVWVPLDFTPEIILY